MSFQFYDELVKNINDYSLKINNNIVSNNDLYYLHRILLFKKTKKYRFV